ncbi:1,2-phenylacetyl-CoA epoxidase subunit PaaE [Rhizomonospora bruguierae]|uniref:1,2-phenylacetyl-CoA epoxidase subunit PaaE n=1 Tax=Rhizomonospora bruguierae TaxID=1581705 RepID=UPI001BCC339E|nr:1,2-phenylacetyl-CoA epoxidase subunit PaaE [Micromonospora sp. NBRC 107566]
MPEVSIRRPARRRPAFHPLPVTAVDRLTDDAVAVTFAVPEELREAFAFRAGQHLTVRLGDARRSYSICSPPALLAERGLVRIGVKRVPGGVFSGHAAAKLRAGDRVDVLPPLGHFTTDLDPTRARRYAAIVAGSGITPVLSIIATALATEPASTFLLIYGNRYARSVMFAEELADLKDRYPQRLQVVHVLSREPREAELLSGRLDAERLPRLLDALAGERDEWFLCGPYGMVTDAQKVLAARGVPRASVHVELFFAESPPAPPPDPEPGAAADVQATILLDGRASTVAMGRHERVLDAALRVRPELPYACRGGVCSTCRARVVEGTVEMAANWALEPDELAGGYVLTCQSTVTSATVTVDYDA